MYPPQFDYYRSSSVEEALELLASDADAEILAGGQSLLTELKGERRRSSSDSYEDSNPCRTPEMLVDVGRIDSLRGIEVDAEGTTIGALTTYADVVAARELWERAPAFTEAAANVGDVQVRNRGTVGGNLAQADPDGDLPAAALAGDATISIRGRDGERTVDADEFFCGPHDTAVGEDELVTEIRVPHAGPTGAYVKKTHPASGYAMVGVAAVLALDDEAGTDTITDVRIAATGVAECPARLSTVEDALVDVPVDDADALETAAERAGDDLDSVTLRSDAHASGEFRAHLLSSYVHRALETALERTTSDADPEVATDGGVDP